MRKILFIICVFFLIGCAQSQGLSLTITNVDGKRVQVTAEIADTDDERSLGLMHRAELPKNHGMLFVFEKEQPLAFWMKNTRIPLDILYIDQYGTVVDVQTMQPCISDPCETYPSSQKAMYALELNAGFALQHGITKNTQVSVQEFVQNMNVNYR